MNHAVLGAGGIGGLVGGALARLGLPVTLLVRPEAVRDQPATLTVSSAMLGDFVAAVQVSDRLEQPVDVLWVTVKSTQLESALRAVPDAQVGGALVVPLLNGIDHVAHLRAVYGRVVPGTIRVEAERTAPGRIHQVSPFAAMQLAGAGDGQVERLAEEVRRAGFQCEVLPDEATMLWSKLAFLAPLALTTTARGATLGEVRDDPAWRARLEACVREACAASTTDGAGLDPAAVLARLDGLPGSMRSSMQKDVEAGRQPELDAIAGPIVRRGEAHGIDATATRELMELIAGRVG